jgi:acyl-CoA thioesterase YciA
MGCSGFNPVSYLGARQAYSGARRQKARSCRGRIQLHVVVFSAQMPEEPRGELVIQTIAMPKDTNANGDIFGGWLTSQMDLGSGILAAKTAQARVVTVAMEGMSFLEPVRVGDTVSCYARLEKIGRTSMTIPVEVWVTRHMTGEKRRVTHGVFTLVAVDEFGKPIPVKRDQPRMDAN